MKSLDRSVLTLAALIVTLLVGIAAGKELLAPPQHADSVKEEDGQQVRVVNLEDRPGASGLAAIGSVIIGGIALFFSYLKTRIAEKSRIDPLLQAHLTIKADLVGELVGAMRECLRAAEGYRRIREKMHREGEPDIPSEAEGERGTELLRARRRLNRLELKAKAVLPEEMLEDIGSFRESLEPFRSTTGEVATEGEDMFEELTDRYWTFLESARESLGAERLEEDTEDLFDSAAQAT